jgi:hypothetical protein
MLREIRDYSRMAAGIIEMQRSSYPSDPVKIVREGIEKREETFLQTTEKVIFQNPNHPYLRMFRLAGCEFQDLARQVRSDGLDRTLLHLHDAGIYLRHDEWKGKMPIVRSGVVIPARVEDFRNPMVEGWMQNSSSGSTGKPIRSSRSTAALIHAGVYQMLRALEFGDPGCLWIDVKGILPSPSGLNSVLRGRRGGTPIDRWFTAGSAFADHWHYRFLTSAMVTIGNCFGARAPYPEYLPYNDFLPIAEYIAKRRAEGRTCFIHGFASPLVRIAAAALDKGLDISGAIFMCGGEALSPAKRKVFETAGARAFSSYVISEVGHVGAACGQMAGSCVHLFEDAIAAIGIRRPDVDDDDPDMKSLHFTTLAPYAPNVFINAEMDDDGVIGPALCDCAYSRSGFRRQIDRINSFAKANPQGATFHRNDLVDVIEQILPLRLGGKPGDYQLMECEAANGQTQVRLLVSPRAGVGDTSRVRELFLTVMRPRWNGAMATREWIFSEGVEVVIAEPIATRTGKVHPVRLLSAYARTEETNGR